MAGFLLVHESSNLVRERAEAVFQAGGGETRRWVGGGWSLLARSHLLPDDPPWIEDKGGRLLVVTGNCVVAGLARQEGRQWLARVLAEGGDPSPRLRGAFVLLFLDSAGVRLVGDAGGLMPAFAREDGTALSSSMTALAAGQSGGAHLDAAALRRWLLLGFPLSPDTAVHGIRRLAAGWAPSFPDGLVWARAALWSTGAEAPGARASRAEHVDWQLTLLRRYFADLAPHATACGVDVGISGGYDSRLLTLLLREAGIPFSLHTLVKRPDNPDYLAARALAAALDLPLGEHRAPDWSCLDPDEQRRLGRETLAFYDHRPAAMMSLTKADYHPDYRAGLLGERRLAISGVGGEIYRNHNFSRTLGKGPLAAWIGYYLADPMRDAGVRDAGRAAELLDDLVAGLRARLGLPVGVKADFDLARRMYGELWLPDWHGQRNSAENRLAGYLAPFTDAGLVASAFASRSRLGVDGAFEAEMLRRLDPRVAALPSSYGHGLDRLPARVLMRSALRCWTPDPVKLALARRLAATRTPPPPPAGTAAGLPPETLGGLDLATLAADPTRRELLWALGEVCQVLAR